MRRNDLATVQVLVLRDLKRFFRQKSRIAGALMQPLIFWVILGFGLSGTFRLAPLPSGESQVSYLQYFFPGIVSMMVLFTALFSTMSVIEDRNTGFLQGVLTAPSSRASLVIGKILGGVSVAMVQVSLFLLLSPLAGFSVAEISWGKLYLIIFLSAFGINAVGFFLAWWLNSIQGYHAIMSVLLIPLWLVSGAMFPIQGHNIFLRILMTLNPMTYCVEGIRFAFYGGLLPDQVGIGVNRYMLYFLVTLSFATVATWMAVRKCKATKSYA